jgi:hypothetical protein
MIIGLMGAAGSGKTTAARHLADAHGASVYSFAKPLKRLVQRAFDLSFNQVFGTQADKERVDPRYGVSPRWLLQRIGTEGCRTEFGKDFWTEQCLRSIARDAPAFAVIEDVRFVDEATAVRVAGGVVWRLEVDGARASSDDGGHASERGWLDAPCDAVIRAPITPGSAALLSAVDRALAAFRRVGGAPHEIEADGDCTAYPREPRWDGKPNVAGVKL